MQLLQYATTACQNTFLSQPQAAVVPAACTIQVGNATPYYQHAALALLAPSSMLLALSAAVQTNIRLMLPSQRTTPLRHQPNSQQQTAKHCLVCPATSVPARVLCRHDHQVADAPAALTTATATDATAQHCLLWALSKSAAKHNRLPLLEAGLAHAPPAPLRNQFCFLRTGLVVADCRTNNSNISSRTRAKHQHKTPASC